MMPTFHDLLTAHLDALPHGYVAAVEAERFRDHLRAHHPEVLDAYLAEREVWTIHQAISALDRRTRAVARYREGARRFAAATDDPTALSAFHTRYVVNAENLRKSVADMTGPDHDFVATHYETSGNRLRLLAEFHRVIARKVGNRRTADVLDPEQYEELLHALTGDHTSDGVTVHD